jgi:hypothetical protein
MPLVQISVPAGSLTAEQKSELVALCVPKTSSTSCDQAVFVDQAVDVSPLSDAVLVEVCRFG